MNMQSDFGNFQNLKWIRHNAGVLKMQK